MNKQTQNDGSVRQSLVISYLTLRRSLGYLGITFSFILWFGVFFLAEDCNNVGDAVQDSVSAFYHTIMGDVFVLVTSMIGVFLFSYRGYDVQDRWVSRIAAICAIGVALLPTSADLLLSTFTDAEAIKAAFKGCSHPSHITNNLVGKLHLFFAAAFFLAITYMSLRLFTKSDKVTLSDEKRNRNRIYITCGCVMLGCLIGIALYWLVLQKNYPGLADYKPVFVFETIALAAFGISWLTKGQVIFKDAEKEA